jgi:hypothetical protein
MPDFAAPPPARAEPGDRGERADLGDLGDRKKRRRRATTANTRAIATVSRRRMLWICGGVAGCAVLAVALMAVSGGAPATTEEASPAAPPAQIASGDDHAEPAEVAAPAAERAEAKVAHAPADPARPHVRPAAATPAIATSERAATPSSPKPPRVPLRAGPRQVRRLGGKKLVVEYAGRPSEAAVPGLVAQTAEDPAIARARSAYVSGNQKLFAGDAAGAIEAYHEALALYPGYVGGYRGLGLAYALRGDAKQALAAFKTYVSAAPTAKDVAIIKKRIARLQGK